MHLKQLAIDCTLWSCFRSLYSSFFLWYYHQKLCENVFGIMQNHFSYARKRIMPSIPALWVTEYVNIWDSNNVTTLANEIYSYNCKLAFNSRKRTKSDSLLIWYYLKALTFVVVISKCGSHETQELYLKAARWCENKKSHYFFQQKSTDFLAKAAHLKSVSMLYDRCDFHLYSCSSKKCPLDCGCSKCTWRSLNYLRRFFC